MNTLRNGSVNGLQLLYRGSLKSCNYRCSYCPFSKHRVSDRELGKDREQWAYFVETVRERAEGLKIRSLLVAPYGEALIHPWYWEGFGRVSSVSGIRAVGAQTNLSFPIRESLELFLKAGGRREKLYLWATFHPEMATAEEFAKACGKLAGEGIHLCAGAVGAPKHAELLKNLRAKLPKEIGLWINRMDGLKRPYTQEETEEFLKIDPYFLRELSDLPADPGKCRNRLFVEGNGKLRICNIGRYLAMSWDSLWERRQEQERQNQEGQKQEQRNQNRQEMPDVLPEPVCGQKRCSCYLAYGGRQDFMNQVLFGPEPIFRVPRRAKAVFLDIVGTLLPAEGSRPDRFSPWILAGLEGLYREKIPLFFATTLPYREARQRCGGIWHLFSGGIFAGGAHLVVNRAGERWESIQALEETCLPVLERVREDLCCRMRSYRRQERLYKVTLLRPEAAQWSEEERTKIGERLRFAGLNGIRAFAEGNCLQVVPERATKAEGVRRICRQLQISPEETAAAGDSPEDAEMLELCGGVRIC